MLVWKIRLYNILKINYSLNDKTIAPIIEKEWFWNDWKNIWEWLLKKAWFDDATIKEYKKWNLSSKNEKIDTIAKTAFEKMEEANLAVWKEYKEWISKLQKWLSLKDIYPNLSNKLILQLEKLYKKDNINISPKKEWKI